MRRESILGMGDSPCLSVVLHKGTEVGQECQMGRAASRPILPVHNVCGRRITYKKYGKEGKRQDRETLDAKQRNK